MTNSSGAGPGAHVMDEAAEWFVNFRVGDADGARQAQFDRWLRRSPENVQAYLEIAGTWADLPAARPEVDVAALVAGARRHSNVVAVDIPAPGGSRRRPIPGRRGMLAAAALLCACGLGALLWATRGPEYLTGIGEQRFFTLEDGSTVQLNTRTRIRVVFSGARRRIELLGGQALFTIAKDAARPFVVDSGGARISVVGTQFDVYRKSQDTVVTVVDGRVSLGGQMLDGGEQATLTVAGVLSTAAVDVSAAIAWTQRRLVFSSTPLREVVAEFNRYNLHPLEVADPLLGDMRISGTYVSTDPASLLNFLRDDPGIGVSETGGRVRIFRR